MTSPYLTPAEAADFLRISEAALKSYRLRGGGPEFMRLGRRTVRYPLQSLHDWMDAQKDTAHR